MQNHWSANFVCRSLGAFDGIIKVIDGYFCESQSPTAHNNSFFSVTSHPPPLIRSTSNSPSRPPSVQKTMKKANKRPAPYATPSRRATAKTVHSSTKKLPLRKEMKLADVVWAPPSLGVSGFPQQTLPMVPSLMTHQAWTPPRQNFYVSKLWTIMCAWNWKRKLIPPVSGFAFLACSAFVKVWLIKKE